MLETRQYPKPEIIPNHHPTIQSWLQMKDAYGSKIPRDVLDETEKRLSKAIDVSNSPERGKRADSAFLIHTRRVEGSEPYLDDPGRCFPALSIEHKIPYPEIERFWNTLPPFEVGKIEGVLRNGSGINLSIISVPITPQKLQEADSAGGRMRYARPRIEESVEFARKLGAKVVGLGETLASLTHHAKTLSEKFPDTQFATGHAFTTYFITEWVREAATLRGEEVSESSITIIGADGSIGSSTTDLLAEEGVGRLVLHDKYERKSKLEKRARDLQGQFPYLCGKIVVTGGDEELEAACKRSQIIVCASSNAEPFIKAHHLNLGSIIINDSQPPGITLEEAALARSISPWVLGRLPERAENSFKYGLIDEAEWTCALEVIAKTVAGDSLETVGPVTPERVKKAEELARKLGFSLPEPQAYGRLYPLDFFKQT